MCERRGERGRSQLKGENQRAVCSRGQVQPTKQTRQRRSRVTGDTGERFRAKTRAERKGEGNGRDTEREKRERERERLTWTQSAALRRQKRHCAASRGRIQASRRPTSCTCRRRRKTRAAVPLQRGTLRRTRRASLQVRTGVRKAPTFARAKISSASSSFSYSCLCLLLLRLSLSLSPLSPLSPRSRHWHTAALQPSPALRLCRPCPLARSASALHWIRSVSLSSVDTFVV